MASDETSRSETGKFFFISLCLGHVPMPPVTPDTTQEKVSNKFKYLVGVGSIQPSKMPQSNPSGSLHNEASEWDELEARSLVFAEIDGPQERLAAKRNLGDNFRWRHVGILVILAVCAFMAYVREDVLALLMMDIEEEQEKEHKDILGDLKTRVADARKEVEKLLDEDYGKFKDEVFNKDTIMNAFNSPSKLSADRLQRRILIKILEAQLLTSNKVDFNWVVGGHSAAAAHGNLFNQSYAYILEETARPTFEALGITFYGKNYAMGGTKSAPENALCMSAVYGPELDILSWDFGMTDGSRAADLYNIWSQRAGVHPTTPTIISFGSNSASMLDSDLEKAGMSAFRAVFVEEKRGDPLAAKFPDSDDPKVDVSELPRGVKYYRCGGRTESGEPCGDNTIKFHTKDVCPKNIKGQVSWHNGYKDHLLRGRVSGLFLIENVFEALSKLEAIPPASSGNGNNTKEENDDAVSPSISKEYLNYLYNLEGRDKKSFMSSKVPRVPHFEGDLEDYHDAFLRANNICRYSYLPSYTRYSGIMTENPQEIKYLGGGRTTYQDEGVRYEKQPAPKPEGRSEPLLVYNSDNDRAVCEHADIDYHDYFGIRNEDKWVTTIVPNDSEYDAFSIHEHDAQTRLGIVTVCVRFFPFGRYPPDHVFFESMFNTTETTMKVNDVPVTNQTKIGTLNAFCHVLKNENGYVFPSSDEHGPGKYELQFKVPQRGGSLYLSSFIIF